ncbi:MAG TPA: hypothetical protein VFF29_04665 [Bacteroidota bacterium]|nr:hypothetical protein [Bacteroidota bacterium]
MKNILLFALLLFHFTVFSQTAIEILTGLQATYRELINYTDRGTYTTFTQSQSPDENLQGNTSSVYKTYEYHVAIDSNENVFHWIITVDAQSPIGWEYKISADQQEGSYKRLFGNYKSEPRSIDMACASLYGVGGGILDMAAGLMFPYLYDSVNAYMAPMFKYDSIKYVQDTTLNGDACQVLEFFDSYYQTAEMIRYHEHRRDSILNQHITPPGFAPPHEQPGLVKLKERLFIRIADGLIVRMDRFSFRKDEYVLHSSVMMNPVVNEEDFEKYLKY